MNLGLKEVLTLNLGSELTDKIKELCNSSEILSKLKKDKKAILILTVGLVGMLLIVFSGNGDSSYSAKESENTDYSFYNEDEVKKELTELIESIDGAGETILMITYKSDKETVFATDTEDNIGNDGTKTKKEYVIIKSNSVESGLPLKIIYPEVKGVAVICEGGDNHIVREKIYSLVCALFSISSNSVSVASMS